jgi:fibronectin type 3 domain-containing protein
VGISILSANNAGTINESYGSEKASLFGGGGISSYVSIPSFQTAAATSYYNLTSHSYGSTSVRNVPDVVFTADPATSYGIYITDPTEGPGWYSVWGSSAASPIWAAFMTRVNQGRVALGESVVGWVNPAIYQIAQSSDYSNDFHDITAGINDSYPNFSGNDYYPAAAGYDDTSGLGSFNGLNLYNEFLGPAAPAGLNAAAGNAQISLNWTASSGAASYNVERSTANGGPYTLISTSGTVTTTNYTDTSLTNGQIYYYVVNAVNNGGIQGANSTQASATPQAASAPIITAQPGNQTVTQPAPATFTIAASGSPAPTYQWMESISGGAYVNVSGGSGATSTSYTTPATLVSNSGTQYKCVVTNGLGSVTSNAATLTVYSLPSISAQPSNQTVTAPAAATFTLTAAGTPSPTYQWMESVNGGSYADVSGGSGATSASYTTPATTGVNNGALYKCVITNAAGSVTSNVVTLTVDSIPVITAQPSSQTVAQPNPATFTVTADGAPAPAYQWMESISGGAYVNVSGGSGATSASYTTPATLVANTGTQYECVITNGLGSVTSSAATLTVLNPVNSPSALSATILAARVGSQIVYGGVSMTWKQSTSPNIIQNKIYRSIGAGAYALLATVSASTAYVDKNVVHGTAYNYEVAAVNSIGAQSGYSNPVTVNY